MTAAGSADSEGRPDRPFFFIHVMKTGGTTFAFHLQRVFSRSESYPNPDLDRRHAFDVEPYVSIPKLRALPDERRREIRMYSGHFPFMATELLGVDPIRLTILRHPVERTLSMLRHFKRLGGGGLFKGGSSADTDPSGRPLTDNRFADLPIEAIYDDPFVFEVFVENHQTKLFSVTSRDNPETYASSLTQPQLLGRIAFGSPKAQGGTTPPLSVVHVDAERLQSAKTNLESVDVVGLHEFYGEFIEELRGRFGWWPDGFDSSRRANASDEGWEAPASLLRRIVADSPFDMEFYEFARQLVEARYGARPSER
jgi:hypothetical protein